MGYSYIRVYVDDDGDEYSSPNLSDPCIMSNIGQVLDSVSDKELESLGYIKLGNVKSAAKTLNSYGWYNVSQVENADKNKILSNTFVMKSKDMNSEITLIPGSIQSYQLKELAESSLTNKFRLYQLVKKVESILSPEEATLFKKYIKEAKQKEVKKAESAMKRAEKKALKELEKAKRKVELLKNRGGEGNQNLPATHSFDTQ